MENKWMLESLIVTKSYHKDRLYNGNIKFKDQEKMEFTLNLDSDKCAKLVAIISDEIVSSAKMLSEQMVKSMLVALPVTEVKEIEN